MNNSKKAVKLQTENEIFALDIGTRTVVGVLGHKTEDNFVVDDWFSVPHKIRAMTDGQIEDISEVAKIAGKVKEELEIKNDIKLSEVSIAAAGRALKTCHVTASIDIEDKGYINDDMLKFLETEAIGSAQKSLDENSENKGASFYCVGHTAVKYFLDDYPIKSLIGHRGKTASAEIIAAFLPSPVVESLYSVMDMCGLTVKSLTLEPIAAMNVIIPPEVRLINIALVDIGAGTSDIAISRDGSIVAYAMATVAGDEITEDIIRKYLVDFPTAEEMKLSCGEGEIKFKNILGIETVVDSDKFFESLYPTVDMLAETIANNILGANGGESPAAVFLVGGGSRVPSLAKIVAEKLDIPEERVVVGTRQFMRNIDTGDLDITGPEFVTPIGIGVTSTVQRGYDFSTITLNGEKIRVFDTKKITVVDLLRMAGYKPNQIIGKTGRNLVFVLNGERKTVSGKISSPAEITINGVPASIDSPVSHGDDVSFKPAENGSNAEMPIVEIAGDVSARTVTVDDVEYPFGTFCTVNDMKVTNDYKIQNYDDVKISVIETLGDLMLSLPFDSTDIVFLKGGKRLRFDYVLREGDDLVTCDKDEYEEMLSPPPMPAMTSSPSLAQKAAQAEKQGFVEETSPEKEKDVSEKAPNPAGAPITVILNGRPTLLEQRNSPHEFLELMALVNIDTKHPPEGKTNIAVTLNGKDAGFMDPLKEGDVAVVRWE